MQVLGGLTFSTLAAGDGHLQYHGQRRVVLRSNNAGQLGDGGTARSPIPVSVANQDRFDD